MALKSYYLNRTVLLCIYYLFKGFKFKKSRYILFLKQVPHHPYGPGFSSKQGILNTNRIESGNTKYKQNEIREYQIQTE